MSRISYCLVLCLPFLFLSADQAFARDLWSIELRSGAAFATQEFGENDLGTGLGIEGRISYSVKPHLAVYGGWDWFHFGMDEPTWGSVSDVEETGYVFGLSFKHPVFTEDLHYYIRAGGTFDHIETENEEGDILGDSEHGLGWEVGSGMTYDLTEHWFLSPGIRYRSLSRDIEVGGESASVDLSYIALDVGISYSF